MNIEMTDFNCIDLDIVKNEIVKFASISEAQDFIINEKPIFNPLVIKKNALETKEAMSIIENNINIQFSGISCVNDLLDKADKNISLTGIELKDVLVFHNHCERIVKIFKNIEEELNIKDYTDSINISTSIFDEVNACIDNTGEIKEDASTLLKEINSKINNLNKRLYSKAEQFVNSHIQSLQETSVYLRENRITFLVKNSDKNKFGGYTYGSSSSGLACYVEPQIFVDMNNEMLSLINDRSDEINRIFRKLTYLISSVSDDYRRNFESLVKLNVIFSKANFGVKYNAIIPEFVEDDYFEFKDLVHPLLDIKTAVSNTYRIYEPYRGIVISGTNTGGKTVSLKAIGLSIIMSYLGIPILASEARVPIYRNVYVDIDDNQSIQDSLSTFSAHISNINNILNNADRNSLILIDELISGTDPSQAQAISLAIMDEIKKIGSIFVITTHFDDVKNYSYKDESILLSSVGFDNEKLQPTYKYYENSIGSSNAIEIASRYLDSQSIIDNAKKYLQINQTKQDKLLDKLSKQMEELNIEKSNIEKLKQDYNNLLLQLEKDKLDFNNEKESLKKKYLDELNEYIEDIKNKAIDKLDSIKEKKDTKVIDEINDLVNIPTKQNKNIVFNVGDNVRIKDNEQIGTIIELNNTKATIDIKGMRIKADIKDLTLMPKVEKKQVYKERTIRKNVSKEINLVGQRVEDGLVMMEEYLDSANGARLTSVKVIHGIGTGQLRTALRNRLKKLSYVKSFKDGDFYDGGSAVTIVEFK